MVQQIIISGVTSCQSRGVEALVRSIAAGLDALGPSHITVLTQTPDHDSSILDIPNVACVADPFVVSRSLRDSAPASGQDLVRQQAHLMGRADLLIATGGDVHTADYGVSTKYLAAPAAAQDQQVPVAMLGHSVGPFEDAHDAAAWSQVARRCTVLTTRETLSQQYVVGDLCLPEDHVGLAADPAFLLEATPTERVHATLAGLGLLPGQPYVCLAPSRGIADLRGLSADRHTAALLRLIDCLVSRWGLPILLLPHVHDSRPANDDRILVAELERHCGHETVRAVPGALTAAEYKAIASSSVFTVAERMHAAIAALSGGAPAAAIGYSRKFVGVLSDTYGDAVPLDQVHLDVVDFVNEDNAGPRLVEAADLFGLGAVLAARLGQVTDRAWSSFARLPATVGEIEKPARAHTLENGDRPCSVTS